MITHIIISLLISYILISLAEYYIHRYHMHRNGWINRLSKTLFVHHQKIHHVVYRENFENPNPPEKALVGLDIDYFHTLKFFWIPFLIMGYYFPIEIITLNVVLFVHHWIWNEFHSEMHQPRGKWFSDTPLYRVLRRHHELHHIYPKSNFNIIFIGADILFGTHRSNY